VSINARQVGLANGPGSPFTPISTMDGIQALEEEVQDAVELAQAAAKHAIEQEQGSQPSIDS